MSNPISEKIAEEEKFARKDNYQPLTLSESEIAVLKLIMDAQQPYLVTYQCSRCLENYQKEVRENSWYTLRKDICPICLQDQIPFIDIELPNNARKMDPNAQPLFKPSVEKSPDQIEFDFMDEQYFTLPFAFDEVLFLVSKKESILRDRPNCTPESRKRLFDLAEKIDLQCYALFLHAHQCSDSACAHGEEFISKSRSTDNLLVGSFVHETKRAIKDNHPSERQSKLCEYTKNLLIHCAECCSPSSMEGHCSIYNCSKFRDILEYQRLFQHIST